VPKLWFTLLLLTCTGIAPRVAATPLAPAADGVVLGELLHRGEGVAGEVVTLRWISPEASVEYPAPWVPEFPHSTRPTVAEATTDEAGRFGFEGLIAGHYELVLAEEFEQAALPLTIPLHGPPVMVQLEVELGRHLTGRVRSAAGQPVSGAQVLVVGLEDAAGGNAIAGRPLLVRDARVDGTYLLPGLPGGVLRIEAYHDDHGFSPVERLAADEGDGAGGARMDLLLRDERDRLVPLDQPLKAGIGISLRATSAGPEVASVLPDGPAARAGVEIGDRLLRIGDLDASWMMLAEVLMRCRGAEGTTLRLTLEHAGEPREVVLVRAALE